MVMFSNKGGSGSAGADGKSAYEIAVENGFEGTESEWLTSLKGEKGSKGNPGNDGSDGSQGPKGEPGKDGKDGSDGADGFPTQAEWEELVQRVEALEGV